MILRNSVGNNMKKIFYSLLFVLSMLNYSALANVIQKLEDFNRKKTNTADVMYKGQNYTQPRDISYIQDYIDGKYGFDMDHDTTDSEIDTIAHSIMRTAYVRGPEYNWAFHYEGKMDDYVNQNNISKDSNEMKQLAEHFFLCYVYAFFAQNNAYRQFYPNNEGVINYTKQLAAAAVILGEKIAKYIDDPMEEYVLSVYDGFAKGRGVMSSFNAPVNLNYTGRVEPRNLSKSDMDGAMSSLNKSDDETGLNVDLYRKKIELALSMVRKLDMSYSFYTHSKDGSIERYFRTLNYPEKLKEFQDLVAYDGRYKKLMREYAILDRNTQKNRTKNNERRLNYFKELKFAVEYSKNYLKGFTPWCIDVEMANHTDSDGKQHVIVKKMDSLVAYRATPSVKVKKYFKYDIDALSKQLKHNWGFTGDLCYLNPAYGIIYVFDVKVDTFGEPFNVKYGILRGKIGRRDASKRTVQTTLVKVGKPSRAILESEEDKLRAVEKALENALINNNFAPLPATLSKEDMAKSLSREGSKSSFENDPYSEYFLEKHAEVYYLASMVQGGGMTDESYAYVSYVSFPADGKIGHLGGITHRTPGTQIIWWPRDVHSAGLVPVRINFLVKNFRFMESEREFGEIVESTEWRDSKVGISSFQNIYSRGKFEQLLAKHGYGTDAKQELNAPIDSKYRITDLSRTFAKNYMTAEQVGNIKNPQDVKAPFLFTLSFRNDGNGGGEKSHREKLGVDHKAAGNYKTDYVRALHQDFFAATVLFEFIPANGNKKAQVRQLTAGIPSPAVLVDLEKMKGIVGDFEYESPEEKARRIIRSM